MDFLKENLDVIKWLIGISSIIIAFFGFFMCKTICRKKHIFSLNQEDNLQLDNFSNKILPGLYVKNDSTKTPINLDYKAKNKNLINQLNKLTYNNKLIYIVGEGGSGKSTLTNYIYNNLCYIKNKKTNALYIPIKRLEDSDKPIFDYVYKNKLVSNCIDSFEIGKMKLDFSIKNWNQLLKLLAKHSTLYIFIDGYDEIVYNKSGFDVIDKEIREIILCNNDNVKLIISSRHEPKLYVDNKTLTLYVEKLTDEQKKYYIGEKSYNTLDDVIKEIISTPLLLSMYKTTSNEITNDQDDEYNGYIKNIKTSTDIYWNNYCYYWKKIKKETYGNENSKVVFARYIIPFIAYNLEYKKIENYFTLNDIRNFTMEFSKNFECFKEKFRFNCNIADVEVLLQSDDFENHYLSELSIIEVERQGRYKFSHLMQKNFFAAVYEYYKDLCILETDYSTDEIIYKPYELLDEKVTIHTITRVFYSNLISRLVYNRQSSDFPNVAKYYCIVSDLHYFGDSEFFEKDRDIALNESIDGFISCENSANDKVDVLSKKWLAWNLAFIIFDRLIIKKDEEKYTDNEVANAKYAIKALKYGISVDYAPAYDKFAKIYISPLFNRFKAYNILEIEDIPNESERIEKAKKLLDEACKGRYHFSYNTYGVLLEKEGKLNEAYEKFKMSVDCDPLEFYARARCGLYLMHNYNKIKFYNEIPDGRKRAYADAEKYLKEGYKYYSAIKYNKPYELKGIETLISNLAEYYLLLYYQEDSKLYLNDACDYYTVLFNIYDKACENKQNTYEYIFNNANIMRDVLCYCLVCLNLKIKHKESLIIENILNNNFDDLCKIVYNYYKNIILESENSKNKYPFSVHLVFHFERFKRYYDDFIKLYNEGQRW